MKKFAFKFISFLLICALLFVVPSYVIDPYNVFHWAQKRDNGVEPNKNYIKTKFVIENPDKYNAFLFGSSRAGSTHVEKIEDVTCYNMYYSVGVPAEYLETIKTLVSENVTVKRVYISLDSLSYTVPPETHYSDYIRCPYQRLADKESLWTMYINPLVTLESLKVIMNHGIYFVEDWPLYSYGAWSEYGMDSAGPIEDPTPQIGSGDCLEQTIDTIRETVDFCRDNNIELVIYTNPMSHYTYKTSLERDYLEFLEKLAEVTDYYNFSGLNDITLNEDYYYDTSHFCAEVGDMMLNCLAGNGVNENLYSQGFGWHIDKNNVDELITVLEKGNS